MVRRVLHCAVPVADAATLAASCARLFTKPAARSLPCWCRDGGSPGSGAAARPLTPMPLATYPPPSSVLVRCQPVSLACWARDALLPIQTRPPAPAPSMPHCALRLVLVRRAAAAGAAHPGRRCAAASLGTHLAMILHGRALRRVTGTGPGPIGGDRGALMSEAVPAPAAPGRQDMVPRVFESDQPGAWPPGRPSTAWRRHRRPPSSRAGPWMLRWSKVHWRHQRGGCRLVVGGARPKNFPRRPAAEQPWR